MSSKRRNSQKAELWQPRIEAQKESGKTIPKFCEEQGWNRHTFMYWRRRLSESLECKLSRKKFVSVRTESFSRGMQTRILLPNGVILELGDDLETSGLSLFLKSLCGVNHENA